MKETSRTNVFGQIGLLLWVSSEEAEGADIEETKSDRQGRAHVFQVWKVTVAYEAEEEKTNK